VPKFVGLHSEFLWVSFCQFDPIFHHPTYAGQPFKAFEAEQSPFRLVLRQRKQEVAFVAVQPLVKLANEPLSRRCSCFAQIAGWKPEC